MNLNRSYDDVKAEDGYKRPNIYEKTRKYWAISKKHADKIDYVLGVYRGIVRAVLKVNNHQWTLKDEETKRIFKKEGCCFEGTLITNSPYLNKDISDYPFGSGGAFRHILPRTNKNK